MMLLHLDENNRVQEPTLVLATPDHTHLGIVNGAVDIELKHNLNGADELSFTVYKTYQGQDGKNIEEPLWDEITDFKYVYVPEFDEYFEIEVNLTEGAETTKNVSGTDAGCKELANSLIYSLEINTESDILREEYTTPTVFYDEMKPDCSLLNRVLDKLPNWSVKYVDASLLHIQRMFSADSIDVYSFLTNEVAEEVGCLFQFDSVRRTISAYDLKTVCVDCGYRGEYDDVCPECGSDNLKVFGDDTAIYVDCENFADTISVACDADAVKNTFRMVAGDDNMTAAVRNVNPNGSPYIYYFSEDCKHDMPDELVERIDAYDELVESYTPEYREVMAEIYEDIDKIYYYTHSMMPTVETSKTDAKTEADKLNNAPLAPVGMPSLNKNTSVQTVNTAMKQWAKVWIRSGWFKADIEESAFTFHGTSDDGTVSGTWTGKFLVTNYSDDEDTAYTQTLSIQVWDKYGTWLEQKLTKKLQDMSDADDGSIFDPLLLDDLQEYKDAIKLYGLKRLQSFADAWQGCIDIMIECEQSLENAELYDALYIPYYDKMVATYDEIDVRSKTIEEYQDKLDKAYKRQAEIQNALNFEEWLGTELYHIFLAYKKEQVYSNQNYISTDLENAEILEQAADFIEQAKDELFKSGERQLEITGSLLNFLALPEFQGFKEKIQLGNWIRVGVDEKIYKLRLASVGFSFNNIQDIELTFSNVKKLRNGAASDLQSILQSASSIAGTYDALTTQFRNSKEQTDFVKDFVNQGLDATTVKIVNNANNQNIVINDSGLTARRKEDFVDAYEDMQLKLLSNGLYITSNAWRSSDVAIGKIITMNPETGRSETKMGVQAKNIYGQLILGNELDIYSSDGFSTMSFSNNGLVLNAKSDETGYFRRILDIQKDGESQLYIDSEGNIILASDQIIQMGQTMDRVQANIGESEKLYVKTGTFESVMAEYARIERLEGFEATFHKIVASEAEVDELTAGSVNIYGQLKAASANINTLQANSATVNQLNATRAEIDELFTQYVKTEKLEADYITADNIEAEYAKIATLDAVDANLQHAQVQILEAQDALLKRATVAELNAEIARIDNLVAETASMNQVIATKVTADQVDAQIVNANKVIVSDLEAAKADIDSIEANYVKTETFEAEVADINSLVAKKATIDSLTATDANVANLQANFADITTLLSGSAGVGVLQAIHLTADNFVADDAVIKNAMIDELQADKITSGVLNTSLVQVKSSDGLMIMNGSTQQFKDASGNVRVQIGKDAAGNFSFTVVGEDGKTALYDETGIHSSAVPDGLIVNKMVADNAAIAGKKLDIDSVVESINGASKTISATKVWIDEQKQSVGASFKQLVDADKVFQTNFEVEQGRIDQLIKDTTLDGKTLKDTVVSQSTTIGGIQTTLASVQSDTGTIKSQITEINTTTAGINAKISSIDSELDSVQTTANLAADGVNFMVQKGTDTTSFSLTPEMAQLVAGRFEVKGETVFLSEFMEALTQDEDVDAGGTTINGKFIRTGTITADHLDVDEIFASGSSIMNIINASEIDARRITSGTVEAERLSLYDLVVKERILEDSGWRDTDIETLRIDSHGNITMRGSLSSYNYEPGTDGWAINAQGNAEFNDVIVHGSLITEDAGIVEKAGTGKEVRYWAGATYENRDNAPFIVYSDGSVQAKTGTFDGVWTGSVEIGNIHIADPSSLRGNDALLTITNGANTIKRVELTDKNVSNFTQDIAVHADDGTKNIVLSQNGSGSFSANVTVGTSILTPSSLLIKGQMLTSYSSDNSSNVDGLAVDSNFRVGTPDDLSELEVNGDVDISQKLTVSDQVVIGSVSFKKVNGGLNINII